MNTSLDSAPVPAPLPMRVWTALLILLFLCHLVPWILLVDEEERGFLWGDSVYYTLAAQSLAERGTLDLLPQLSADDLESAVAAHQLARNDAGELVMKHATILPFFGAPFFALLGVRGLLLLNVLFSVGIVAAMVPLLRRYMGTLPALATAYLLGTATLISPYAYNFSADMAGTFFLLVGICALFGRAHFAAGVLFGLAVSLKLSLLPVVAALYAGGLCLAAVRGDDTVAAPSALASWIRLTLGAACGVAPLLAMNYAQFGNVWVTGYQRIALADGGTLSVLSNFNQPLGSGLVKVLFHGMHGLISTNPVLLLGGFGVLPFLRLPSRRRRWEIALLLAAAALKILVISRYDFWDQSHMSNRFLLVVVPLLSPLVGLAVDVLQRMARIHSEPAP